MMFLLGKTEINATLPVLFMVRLLKKKTIHYLLSPLSFHSLSHDYLTLSNVTLPKCCQ